MRRGSRLRRPAQGFGYVGMLFVLAILGVSLGAMGTVWKLEAGRAREQELLHIGQQFRWAICRYYQNPNAPEKRFPASLEDLLMDTRGSSSQRHLRRIYPDPVTGKPEWGLLKTPDGRIQGVFSPSDAPPIKIANFDVLNGRFENARRYSDWVFAYVPGQSDAGQQRCASQAGATSGT